MPLTRNGINRVDLSVIQRASYEEPVEMLLRGAVTADEDPLRGMCEAVMFGQKPPMGTGTVELQMHAGTAPLAGIRPTVSSREQRSLPGQLKRFRENLHEFDEDSTTSTAPLANKVSSRRWGTTPARRPDNTFAILCTTGTGCGEASAATASRPSDDIDDADADVVQDTKRFRPSSPL
jgi:hypothetical protein